MKYHLICGYKRSGKDTFYKKILNSKNHSNIKNIQSDIIHLDPSELLESKCQDSGPYFYVLCSPKYTNSTFCSYEKNLTRIAMADMVKEEINEYFKINFSSQECAEIAKDNLNFYDEETKVYRSLRSYYIEHAMKMRKINPDHWCNKAYMNLLMKDEFYDVMITDWRFKNERTFFDKNGEVITYRIFRKETDDENFFDESEHSLDNENTDFLVVSNTEDIQFAKKKFPQYKDYEIKFQIY